MDPAYKLQGFKELTDVESIWRNKIDLLSVFQDMTDIVKGSYQTCLTKAHSSSKSDLVDDEETRSAESDWIMVTNIWR